MSIACLSLSKTIILVSALTRKTQDKKPLCLQMQQCIWSLVRFEPGCNWLFSSTSLIVRGRRLISHSAEPNKDGMSVSIPHVSRYRHTTHQVKDSTKLILLWRMYLNIIIMCARANIMLELLRPFLSNIPQTHENVHEDILYRWYTPELKHIQCYPRYTHEYLSVMLNTDNRTTVSAWYGRNVGH